MTWETFPNNGISVVGPTGPMDLRVVWDSDGCDVCYVCDTDGDNGNTFARMIACAPDLIERCADLCSEICIHGESLPEGILPLVERCVEVMSRSVSKKRSHGHGR